MAIFKSTNITFDAKNSDTVIGHEAYFQGTLTAKGSLRIDGRIDGAIVDANLVTVGKTGKVKGDISCESCSVSGDINGNVAALDHIEVLSGSKITGDLRAPKIIIEEGAVFNGNCSMTSPKNSKTENSEKAVK
ncbi:MAG: polymer-forming cytoskeletal protein [Elusimicrobiales bacterium]|jgi:cytoskeletal protein CcmA (bactofilin family)